MASSQALILGSILFFSMAVGYTSGAWCICKPGSDAALQKTLDYACGHGADCNPIKSTGACYNPNSMQAHCSYAANSYYQRMSSTGATCDFSGAAYLSNSDPSVSGCSYPASARHNTNLRDHSHRRHDPDRDHTSLWDHPINHHVSLLEHWWGHPLDRCPRWGRNRARTHWNGDGRQQSRDHKARLHHYRRVLGNGCIDDGQSMELKRVAGDHVKALLRPSCEENMPKEALQ